MYNDILYDEDFNLVPEECGRFQIGAGADAWQVFGNGGKIAVNHNGYLAVFLRTATAGTSIYIDPMVINHFPAGFAASTTITLTAWP